MRVRHETSGLCGSGLNRRIRLIPQSDTRSTRWPSTAAVEPARRRSASSGASSGPTCTDPGPDVLAVHRPHSTRRSPFRATARDAPCDRLSCLHDNTRSSCCCACPAHRSRSCPGELGKGCPLAAVSPSQRQRTASAVDLAAVDELPTGSDDRLGDVVCGLVDPVVVVPPRTFWDVPQEPPSLADVGIASADRTAS
jgi:hypothetical protein